jgi:hypothetical protein
MKNLSKIAIKAFTEGSDNYGETPTGEVTSLTHEIPNPKAIHLGTPNPKSHKFYSCTVVLDEGTSGIGFYVKDDVMEVCSGHIVFTIPVTTEIQEELNSAEILQW